VRILVPGQAPLPPVENPPESHPRAREVVEDPLQQEHEADGADPQPVAGLPPHEPVHVDARHQGRHARVQHLEIGLRQRDAFRVLRGRPVVPAAVRGVELACLGERARHEVPALLVAGGMDSHRSREDAPHEVVVLSVLGAQPDSEDLEAVHDERRERDERRQHVLEADRHAAVEPGESRDACGLRCPGARRA